MVGDGAGHEQRKSRTARTTKNHCLTMKIIWIFHEVRCSATTMLSSERGKCAVIVASQRPARNSLHSFTNHAFLAVDLFLIFYFVCFIDWMGFVCCIAMAHPKTMDRDYANVIDKHCVFVVSFWRSIELWRRYSHRDSGTSLICIANIYQRVGCIATFCVDKMVLDLCESGAKARRRCWWWWWW